MSKGSSGTSLSLTRGDIVAIIRSLPPKPDTKFLEEYDDITHPEKAKNSKNKEYLHKRTGLKVRFDPATPGAPGFNGKDHYHVKNPNNPQEKDEIFWLDKDGNPMRKNSKASHIIPKK